MKQNFGKSILRIFCKPQYLAHLSSQLERHGIFFVSFSIFFRHGYNYFFPICIRKSINISVYWGRYLSFRKFKYDPKQGNLLLLLLIAWHPWTRNALKVESTIKTSYVHSSQKHYLISVRLVGYCAVWMAKIHAHMQHAVFLKLGSFRFTSINTNLCVFIFRMFCTYIFYFEIRAFLELFTIYENIQSEHKNWKKLHTGIGDLTDLLVFTI